jgi:hypothetical protein
MKNRTSFGIPLLKTGVGLFVLLRDRGLLAVSTIPQSPDARIKQKMSTLGMTALSEQNGQRQITLPAVRNDDEVHQLGQSERCVPICSAESDASPGRPYLRTDAIESRDNSPSSF